MTLAYAPGKVILFGEHSVVYGRPAIAVPVLDVRATAVVKETRATPGVTIHAEDIGRTIDVAEAAVDEPLSLTVRNTLAYVGVDLAHVRLALSIRSSIPVASGLGSGAAVAAAIVRALSMHLGHTIDPREISAIVYETEKIHHGTPSGVDNTVVVYGQPVYFCRGRPVEIFEVRQPFWLAIADTGVPSLTKETVADVRAAWQFDRTRHERIFERIGMLVDSARTAIENGRAGALGMLMAENQRLLCELRVSSPEIERLIEAALSEGAHGAKLSGGGRGGNVIALIDKEDGERVRGALLAAGARRAIVTKVGRDDR